jgi:hypothetical protein
MDDLRGDPATRAIWVLCAVVMFAAGASQFVNATLYGILLVSILFQSLHFVVSRDCRGAILRYAIIVLVVCAYTGALAFTGTREWWSTTMGAGAALISYWLNDSRLQKEQPDATNQSLPK